MAVARWLETDTYSNKDISAAVSIGVYTADADRVIVCDVSIDQAAGNGDYVVYLTRQINGSGSSYVLLPKTTCTAASGETAIAMQSGMVTVRSGDVLTVYLDGLAGDNANPDTTVRWFELDADVSEAGGGLTAQETANAVHNLLPVGTPAAGSIGDKLNDILAVTNSLDVSAVTQVAGSIAGHLTITVGLTFAEGVTGLTIPADWSAALWTLKNNARDADTAALVQLRATNPAAGSDGLQRLNGAALVVPIAADDGKLTVTQASGRIDVWLSDEMTAQLGAATSLGWDVKFIDAAGDSTGRRGTADVVLTETKTTT